MDGKIGQHHGGPERRESAEERAESLLKKELKRRGWDQKELKRRRKADPGKVQMAKRLRNNHELGMDRRLSDDGRCGLRRCVCPRVAPESMRILENIGISGTDPLEERGQS